MTVITSARQIGQAIRAKRKALSLTQQQLADAANVSRGFIARIEKGAAVAVYPQKLLDVMDVLDLTLRIESPRSIETDDSKDSSEPSPDCMAPDSLQPSDIALSVANSEAMAKAAKIAQLVDVMIPDYIKRLQVDRSLFNKRANPFFVDCPQEEDKEASAGENAE